MVAITLEAATRAAQAQPPTSPPPPTSTPQAPRLYANVDTRCRTGIGSNSKVIATLAAGTTADMLARNSAEGAWLVKLPDGSASCWVRALDASPGGDFQNLPEATAESIVHQIPVAPVNLVWDFTCSYKSGVLYGIQSSLAWTDLASDANGFRIYRQDVQVADLPSEVRQFSDTADVVIGTPFTYSVEAYNEAGASPRLSKTLPFVCK